MGKRVLIFIVLMLMVSVGIAQAQETEFLGIDGTTYTPGSWITVRWHVSNVDLAILEVYDVGQPDAAPVIMEFLSTEGVRDVYLPPTMIKGAQIVLWSANNPSFDHAPMYVAIYKRLRSQTITLTSSVSAPATDDTNAAPCLPTFYFPGKDESNCLAMLQNRVGATYQPFENGFMLWRRDTGDVWVMEKSGLSLDYIEPVYGLMADNPITNSPPTGRSAPANGFGRVWGNVEDVRDAVGWALGPEVGYVMTIQYGSPSVNVPYSYMTLPNDTVVKVFDGGRWTVETP